MPFTITIGQKFWNEELSTPDWDVQRTEVDDAPLFPNDEQLEPKSNWRYVNYLGWKELAEKVGLEDWLNDPKNGLIEGKLGEVQPVTEALYTRIVEAYLLQSAFAEGLPGFNIDSEDWNPQWGTYQSPTTPFDFDYARLKWLRFWMRWALDHCDDPSVVIQG